jgi:hypothetical protein
MFILHLIEGKLNGNIKYLDRSLAISKKGTLQNNANVVSFMQ